MNFIAVHVDDMIIFDVDEISVQELIANLGKRIRIEDKGVLKWFLGIKIDVNEKCVILSGKQQKKYYAIYRARIISFLIHDMIMV